MIAETAAADMRIASDYLTEQVRLFTQTGRLEYLNHYFEEAAVEKRRDRAVEEIRTLSEETASEAYESLSSALAISNELMEREYRAMRLFTEAEGIPLSILPDEIGAVELSPEEKALSPEQKRERAKLMVLDEEYMQYKHQIRSRTSSCTEALIEASRAELERSSVYMDRLVMFQTLLTVILLFTVIVHVIFIRRSVIRPVEQMVWNMQEQRELPLVGASELRFVSATYNRIFREYRKTKEKLTYDATHDVLTGLYNRSAYEVLFADADQQHVALLILDVDKFKHINDNYGHNIGDEVLKRVADVLRQSFRSTDIICRMGGDEFVVIMTRMNSSLRQMVLNKIEQVNVMLQNPEDGLPPVSLSVGVAFSDRRNPEGDLFKDADTALYRVKAAGRCGCAVF